MRSLILFFCLAGLSAAAPAYVQGNLCSSSAGGLTFTCATTGNITAGNLLVVSARWQFAISGGTETATMSTSTGVACTWNTALSKLINTGATDSVAVFFCNIPSTGAETVQLTLTNGNSSSFVNLILAEYSGVSTSGSLDVSAGLVSTASTTACSSGATAALAGTGELAIGWCSGWNNAQTFTTKSGWTWRSAISTNTIGYYDSVQSTASALTFSYTLTSADQWASFVVTFKPSGTGATAARVLPNRISL